MAYCGPTSMMMDLYYLYANGIRSSRPGPLKIRMTQLLLKLKQLF